MPFAKSKLARSLSSDRQKVALNAMQKRAYASEKEENFRWVASLLGTKSEHILTPSDLVDDVTYSLVSDIGEYAELAHGSISPSFVFRNLQDLCRPGYPLAGYGALKSDGAQLVTQFTGSVAGLQGYVAYRASVRQLVLAFSGTSSLTQALKDIESWQTPYPSDRRKSKVHAGFWKMYQGLRPQVLQALRTAFREPGIQCEELVLTGHSMGCTMCYLIALDLMAEREDVLPHGLRLSLVTFGSPRLGNGGLAKYWRRSVEMYRSRFGEASFREYSVKGYNDGVQALPPCFFGFRHLTLSSLYLCRGRMYRVSPSEAEHSHFISAESASITRSPGPEPASLSATLPIGTQSDCVIWPKGGHNYYFRDMEKVHRRMRWLELDRCGEAGWQERYMAKLKVWEKKWGKDSDDSALRIIAVT